MSALVGACILLEQLDDVGDLLGSAQRAARHHRGDQSVEDAGHVVGRAGLRDAHHLGLHAHAPAIVGRKLGGGRFAGEHEEEQGTQAVEVAGPIDALLFALFGAVERAPVQSVCAAPIERRQAKVKDLRSLTGLGQLGDDHRRGIELAVNKPAGVGLVQCVGELCAQLAGALDLERAVLGEDVVEDHPGRIIHDDADVIVGEFEELVDGDEVRRVQPVHPGYLTHHARDELLAATIKRLEPAQPQPEVARVRQAGRPVKRLVAASV